MNLISVYSDLIGANVNILKPKGGRSDDVYIIRGITSYPIVDVALPVYANSYNRPVIGLILQKPDNSLCVEDLSKVFII